MVTSVDVTIVVILGFVDIFATFIFNSKNKIIMRAQCACVTGW